MSPSAPESCAIQSPPLAHPLPVDQAVALVEEAWRLTFYDAFRSTPHRDNDPELLGLASGQRSHLQLLVGCFASLVAERAVTFGLYETVDAFFADGEQAAASDPATAGVDRCHGGDL